jgi:mono/diheme cytochrome c family protein
MRYFIILVGVFILGLVISSCNESPYMQGKYMYDGLCQNCHMADGSGLEQLIPALSESSLLGSPAMVCIIKNGIQDTMTRNGAQLVREMPSYSKLSITEVTNIINYINYRWDKNFKETTIIEVQEALGKCE